MEAATEPQTRELAFDMDRYTLVGVPAFYGLYSYGLYSYGLCMYGPRHGPIHAGWRTCIL